MELWMGLTLLTALCNLLCTAAVVGSQRKRETPAPAAEPEREDTPRALRLEEGFENLMAYQVRLGRGQVTGGEAD